MRLLPLFLVGSVLFGCSVARMRPDPALAKANVWPVNVDGGLFSDDSITFGPWRAVNIERSWKSSSSSTTGPVKSESSKQSWSFTLNSVRVSCTYRVGDTTVAIGKGMTIGGSHGENMVCDTARGDERGVISLVREDSGWRGSIDHAGIKVALSSRHELENGGTSTYSPAGYDARDGNGVFAAIQTINSPVVWMNPMDAPVQELAAAAFVSVYYLEKVPRNH